MPIFSIGTGPRSMLQTRSFALASLAFLFFILAIKKMLDLPYSHNILSHKSSLQLQESQLQALPFSPFISPSEYSQAESTVQSLQKDSRLFVCFGTGGSSLAARVFLQNFNHTIPVHFLESIDPADIGPQSQQWNWPQTRFVFISKSGKTAETLAHMRWVVHTLTQQKQTSLASQCILLSQPTPSPMRELAEKHHIPILNINPEVPGRFSAFTLSSLFPVLCAKGPALKILEAAHTTYQAFQQNPNEHPVTSHAQWLINLHRQGTNLGVLMPYSRPYFLFTLWWRQLWAESLGKDGRDFVPIDAYGPFDQHSQLQLYLDGASSRYYSIILPQATTHESHLQHFAHLLNQSAHATSQALLERKRPLRTFTPKESPLATIASLMIHFMLETHIVGNFYQIDVFNQPAVELIKKHLQ